MIVTVSLLFNRGGKNSWTPQPGVLYIFHHRRPVDDEKLALVELPARVKSEGITIVKAPKSSKDLMYPYVGGPLFKIQIQDGRHEGNGLRAGFEKRTQSRQV